MIRTTLDIDGMMCSMCETHVNDAIRRNFAVKSAKSNRKKGTCVVVSEEELDKDAVAKALGDLGYDLRGMSAEPYQKRRFHLF